MKEIEIATENQSVFASKLIQFLLVLIGFKSRMGRNIAKDKYRKKPARLPKSILKNNTVEVSEIAGKKVWTFSPKKAQSDSVILFLHGGAYYANISFLHWRFLKQLLMHTSAKIIVPDYPLAPQFTAKDTYLFLDEVYEKLIKQNPSKKIVLMGDSAGGGLALGYAQKIRNEKILQPTQIVLFSPWLDVSMSNPEIEIHDKADKVLNLNGLKEAGKNYAGSLGFFDYRVSPLYGELQNLGQITIFVGTKELLIADARRFRQIVKENNIEINYFEYNMMFHDWILVPCLKATKNVIKTTTHLLYHNQ
jgi:acetyl esterase/lipase